MTQRRSSEGQQEVSASESGLQSKEIQSRKPALNRARAARNQRVVWPQKAAGALRVALGTGSYRPLEQCYGV